jgi:hypothetical protein
MSERFSQVDIETLHALLALDPATGRLYWKDREPHWFQPGRNSKEIECIRWNTKYAGKEAFAYVTKHGYRSGCILWKYMRAHRVVFAMHYGRWPNGHIDHIDRDPSNNRPENLREASNQQNAFNRKLKATNTSGYRGVSWNPRLRKFTASISRHGKSKHLGVFDDAAEAALARDAAVRASDGEFAALNFSAP